MAVCRYFLLPVHRDWSLKLRGKYICDIHNLFRENIFEQETLRIVSSRLEYKDRVAGRVKEEDMQFRKTRKYVNSRFIGANLFAVGSLPLNI